jgi:hypothetical protein
MDDQKISVPLAVTDGLSELKKFNVHDCVMDLPFAIALLELVNAAAFTSKRQQEFAYVIASFEDRVSQNCGIPLVYTVVSLAVDGTMSVMALPALFQFLRSMAPRRWRGRENSRWTDRAVALFVRSAILWIVWRFVPIHHNGLLMTKFKTLSLEHTYLRGWGFTFIAFIGV